ncbi:MAG: 4-phosphoerythronate dehydrogenase [Rikenellaceae bacterium]|jgi:erythronate-4-phosphate dehydrogenase|nr:4-phosphoerythronate dehydrogenase [Rikenellaceae bacterium]
MKIVADRDIPFLQGGLEPFAEVVYLSGDRIKPSDVVDADALLIRTRTRCDEALLAGSRVKFIGTATIGFDHIDTAYCGRQGIAVVTAKGSNKRGVLQWVSAALAWLAAERGKTPEKTTLGIIGVGNIGSLVAEYATEWGYRVMCSDPPRERAEKLTPQDGFFPLHNILSHSDIITIHTPLITIGADATRNMVDSQFLGTTKPDAVIVNSSRGAVVEPSALRNAIGQRGFVIDTWNNEPDIDRAVLQAALLATPHIAGYSEQGKAMATAMIVNGLAHHFGLPLSGWYPEGVARSEARPIMWNEMCSTIPQYFDIAAQSRLLKARPEDFETFRNNYTYRTEYF